MYFHETLYHSFLLLFLQFTVIVILWKSNILLSKVTLLGLLSPFKFIFHLKTKLLQNAFIRFVNKNKTKQKSPLGVQINTMTFSTTSVLLPCSSPIFLIQHNSIVHHSIKNDSITSTTTIPQQLNKQPALVQTRNIHITNKPN